MTACGCVRSVFLEPQAHEAVAEFSLSKNMARSEVLRRLVALGVEQRSPL